VDASFRKRNVQDMSWSERISNKILRIGAAIFALGAIHAASPSIASAFPWSTDMFQGPAVQPLEIAPRVMPDGTLPMDGIHYNIHYGQPKGMPDAQALPAMKLELMTVRLHNPLQSSTENLAHGRALFETVCAPCHGATGRGNGSVVHLLQHKPANLLTGVSSNLPDGYMFGYIRNGGIWMPSYDDAMSQTERWQIVLYVRELEKEYGGKGANMQAALVGGESGVGPYQNVVSGRNPVEQGHNGLIAEPALFQPGLDESGSPASLGASQFDVPQSPGNAGQ
jgi:mono/diheme cytochrome c family protein